MFASGIAAQNKVIFPGTKRICLSLLAESFTHTAYDHNLGGLAHSGGILLAASTYPTWAQIGAAGKAFLPFHIATSLESSSLGQARVAIDDVHYAGVPLFER